MTRWALIGLALVALKLLGGDLVKSVLFWGENRLTYGLDNLRPRLILLYHLTVGVVV